MDVSTNGDHFFYHPGEEGGGGGEWGMGGEW